MGEGLDSNVVIGVVGAGWHPGNSFSIDVCPTDGTAKSRCKLFVCAALHNIYRMYHMYVCSSM